MKSKMKYRMTDNTVYEERKNNNLYMKKQNVISEEGKR